MAHNVIKNIKFYLDLLNKFIEDNAIFFEPHQRNDSMIKVVGYFLYLMDYFPKVPLTEAGIEIIADEFNEKYGLEKNNDNAFNNKFKWAKSYHYEKFWYTDKAETQYKFKERVVIQNALVESGRI